jgi:hypothetical protein
MKSFKVTQDLAGSQNGKSMPMPQAKALTSFYSQKQFYFF